MKKVLWKISEIFIQAYQSEQENEGKTVIFYEWLAYGVISCE